MKFWHEVTIVHSADETTTETRLQGTRIGIQLNVDGRACVKIYNESGDLLETWLSVNVHTIHRIRHFGSREES